MPTNTTDIDTTGFPQLPDGYTSWLYLGTAVDKKYKAPWVYRATSCSTWGVIKSNNQALSGCTGDYLEAVPAPCIGDPLTVDDMKINASEREYARWWTHRSASAKQHQAVQRFLDNTIGTTTSIRATYYSDTEALVLTKDTYYRCQTMRYARAYSLANSTCVDAELRDFTRQLDNVINGATNVGVSWSTVNNTYCTPMSGYDTDDNDEPESITGSCMEKFSVEDFDGIGHDVFDVYFRLERLGHIKMIRIKIDDEYVGRAICWKPDLSQNTWIMDRIYCRMDRGCMPDAVITSIEEFAAANNITRRFHKCRAHALRSITPSRFDVTGLSEFEYYPFFDSYAGVSSRGVEEDTGYCSIVCDSPSGGYSSGNDDDHADEDSDDDAYVNPEVVPLVPWSGLPAPTRSMDDATLTELHRLIFTSTFASIPLRLPPPSAPPFPPAPAGKMWAYRGVAVRVEEDYIFWVDGSNRDWQHNTAPSIGSGLTHYATLVPIPAMPNDEYYTPLVPTPAAPIDEYINRVPPPPPTPTPNHHWEYRGTGADIAGTCASISIDDIGSPTAHWAIGIRSNRIRHMVYLELVSDTHA